MPPGMGEVAEKQKDGKTKMVTHVDSEQKIGIF